MIEAPCICSFIDTEEKRRINQETQDKSKENVKIILNFIGKTIVHISYTPLEKAMNEKKVMITTGIELLKELGNQYYKIVLFITL